MGACTRAERRVFLEWPASARNLMALSSPILLLRSYAHSPVPTAIHPAGRRVLGSSFSSAGACPGYRRSPLMATQLLTVALWSQMRQPLQRTWPRTSAKTVRLLCGITPPPISRQCFASGQQILPLFSADRQTGLANDFSSSSAVPGDFLVPATSETRSTMRSILPVWFG